MTTENRLGRGRLRRFATASAAFLLTVGPAAAAVGGSDPFAGLPPIHGSQLAELRGGMMIGGIPVDFAVVLNTTIRNSVDAAVQPAAALQTTLAINNAGGIANATTTAAVTAPVVSLTSNAAPASSTPPATTSQTAAVPAPTVAAPTVAAATTSASAGSAPVSASLTTPDGATSVTQQITSSQVQTLVNNAASGATITHSTTIDVTLPSIIHTTQNFTSHFQASTMGLESAIAGLRH